MVDLVEIWQFLDVLTVEDHENNIFMQFYEKHSEKKAFKIANWQLFRLKLPTWWIIAQKLQKNAHSNKNLTETSPVTANTRKATRLPPPSKKCSRDKWQLSKSATTKLFRSARQPPLAASHEFLRDRVHGDKDLVK